jgi:hypothetical protein
MDKFVKIKDTSKNVEVILPSEELFKRKLLDRLGDEYLIIKSQYKYCSIDFCIVNKFNLKILHLEHKERNCLKNAYPSTIINYSKLMSYKRNYQNTIMIWGYKENAVKFLVYSEDLLKYKTSDCKNQEVIYIKNDILLDGLDNLISTIIQKLK